MALKGLNGLGSDAAALVARACGHMGCQQEVVALLRIATLGVMLNWIADEIVRAVRATWRDEYPYAADGYVAPSATSDLIAHARAVANVSEKQYAVMRHRRALFEAIVSHMALLGSLETVESLAETRRNALAAAQAVGSPWAAEEHLLREGIALFRHDHDGLVPQSDYYAILATNPARVGTVPLHVAGVVLALRARRADSEQVGCTVGDVIEIAKVRAGPADRDRFERMVECREQGDDRDRWMADIFVQVVRHMLKECGLDAPPYDHDPGPHSGVSITPDNGDDHVAATGAAQGTDPWAESKRLIAEQSFPYDYGTVDLRPQEVVDGQVYEIIIETGATGWHRAQPRRGKWFTPDGSGLLAYPDSVTNIRISTETIRAEVVAARNHFEKRAWKTKDDIAANEEALDRIRRAAERLTKPRTAARRKLTFHLEHEYRRSIRDILTPGFIARDAELKKLGM